MFRRVKEVITPQALLVGLGNPGPEYAGTRHNVGFMAIEELARRHKIKLGERRFRARYGVGRIHDTVVCLAMPMTFMNLSGDAVSQLARHFNLKPDRILVIYDDMALSVGALRVRGKGSSGGHNGLKSIEQRLATQEYPRVRIGIGSADPGAAIDHVLGTFKPNERADIQDALAGAADAAEAWLNEDIETVMMRFNRREKPAVE